MNQSPVRLPADLLSLSFWGLAALLAVHSFPPAPELCNDCVQYLEGGRSIAAGEGYSTRILFFDEHFRSGRIPAQQTVWPPGYPALIALLIGFGLEPQFAGELISMIAYVASVPAVFLLGRALGGSLWIANLCALWWFSCSRAWTLAASINSDMLFTTLTVISLLLLTQRKRDAALGLSLAVAAIAFSVRYAGIFLLLFLCGPVLKEIAKQERCRSSRITCAGAFGALLVAACILFRNWWISGSFQGGNNVPGTRPIGPFLVLAATETVEMFSGVSKTLFGSSHFLALLSAADLALMSWLCWCSVTAFRNRVRGDDECFRSMTLVAGFSLFYFAGVLWVSRQPMLTFSARYLLPLAPCCICVFLCAFQRAMAPLSSSARGMLTLGMLSLVLVQSHAYPLRLDAAHRQRAPEFPKVVQWVRDHVQPDEPIIVLGEGARVGFRADRPTLAVPEAAFTARDWSHEALRELATTFDAKYLIAPPVEPVIRRFPALSAAARPQNGSADTPEWLTAVAELEGALIYRLSIR